ncbi:nuclear pore complex protein Nup50 [Lingula anatina]|uniref:Nuclear pore complex protein Nup50 n=1 Tax=Lingula anatina TaxID=7574 RepID=A0A1S3ICP6_LINAN|nr:nuclear pore complex protein Nup50 [Lingula anatina]|eukprot:XP_013396012.1 nuclear pore complex protein Nup50 [Lingula anatina]
MSKRIAANQLTDRNWDEEEEAEEAGVFKQASTTVLEQRQIKKAKRRGIGGSTDSNGGTSAFKGFTGFAGLASSTGPEAPAFSFGSKPLTGLSNGAKSTKSSENPDKISVSAEKSNDSNGGDASKSKAKLPRREYLKLLKNLNESLARWVQQHVEKNPYCILTPIFKDYEKHLAEVEKKYPDEAKEEASEEDAKLSLQDKKEEKSTVTVVPQTEEKEEKKPTFGGFTFGVSPPDATKDSQPKPAFSFGVESDAKATKTGGSIFGSSTTSVFGSGLQPFSFAVNKPTESTGKDGSGGETGGDGEEEEYVPPKAEVKQVEEEGALYTKRCKLFYQKDSTWVEKGVGNLHLKSSDGKTQLIVRADTSLGNILLNIMLTSSMPVRRQGKNNVTMMCIPNPPIDPKVTDSKPTMMLIRVKTAEDADELHEKIAELKG